MLSLHHKHFDSQCYQINQVIVFVWLVFYCFWAFLAGGHEHLTYSFLSLAFVFCSVDLTDAAFYTSLIFLSSCCKSLIIFISEALVCIYSNVADTHLIKDDATRCRSLIPVGNSLSSNGRKFPKTTKNILGAFFP